MIKQVLNIIYQVIPVLIGVLFALLLNNWNEERKNRLSENELLTQLHEEFLNNQKQLKQVKKGHEAALHDTYSLIQKFPINVNNVNLDSLNYFFFDAEDGGAIMDRWTFNPSNSIVDAIINNSSFDLIQNSELKIKLLTWKSVFDDYSEDEQNMISFRNSMLVPYLINKGVMTKERFKKANLDYSFLATAEFESLIMERYRGISYIVAQNSTSNELENLEKSIDKILKLTQQ